MTPSSIAPKAASAHAAAAPTLGNLPEWNLADLYPAMDAPAYKRDVAEASRACKAFAETYRGKAHRDSSTRRTAQPNWPRPSAATKSSKTCSAASCPMPGFVYSGDTTDPARAKFYGDAQEKVTDASSDLLFFTLELNRIEDAKLETAMAERRARPLSALARGYTREKPYQLDDKLELLFHEKSITGHSAWNRLFDETIAALRFKVDGQELTLEPTLNLMQDPARRCVIKPPMRSLRHSRPICALSR